MKSLRTTNLHVIPWAFQKYLTSLLMIVQCLLLFTSCTLGNNSVQIQTNHTFSPLTKENPLTNHLNYCRELKIEHFTSWGPTPLRRPGLAPRADCYLFTNKEKNTSLPHRRWTDANRREPREIQLIHTLHRIGNWIFYVIFARIRAIFQPFPCDWTGTFTIRSQDHAGSGW